MTTENFVNLHVHSQASILDGHAKAKDIAKKAKEFGMKAVALTDHGNMFGAVEFFKACKAEGVKPIIGCEVYQAVRTVKDKDTIDRKSGHLVLLCKNEAGYRNLIRLVSDAYSEEAFYYKPRTDKQQLRKYSEGLICLSGCMAGFVQRHLLEGRYEEAKKEALELQDIFGEGNFYLEVQDHGTDEDARLLPLIRRLGEDTGIPFAATNDSHYVEKEDARAQEVLLCINTKSTMQEKDKFAFPSDEFYFKSGDEMRILFSGFPGACENTGKIADMCNFEFEFGHYHIPAFPVPDGFSSTEEYFRHLCREGFGRRYPQADDELKERLAYEIDTIVNMGYVEYFLIVSDYITYAKENGISVGPGRGSAAGSVVAYSLGITDIEPIRYNLLFERFLNPERVSMPDIDTDFCINRRGEVIDYVAKKYGSSHVCQISTIDRQKAKAAIKNVARVYEMPYARANALTKLMPKDPKATISDALELDEFREEYDTDPAVRKVVDMAMRIEGLATNISTHAAGVVVASEPVSSFVPLVRTEKGVATQFDMVADEELGLLKYDFLGLRNLTAIDECIRLIKERKGIDVSFDADTPMDDPLVYDMLARGETVGVFQLESRGITGFMKQLKPTCFEDIVAGISLYRPGPMDSIPEYLENKRSPENISYLTPKLEPILSVTYGCIVYQEQVMQIVRDLAGYSFGRSDLVRRAMSKKKHDVMMKEREYFIHGKLADDGSVEIPGCIRNGVPEGAAEKIFDEMTSFASYAFNKSHAAAYAVITYRTAWLKCYYPAEFMAALMSSEASNHEHLALFIRNAGRMKKPGTDEFIKVLPPSFFRSKAGFSVTEEGDILFGLGAVNGVGRKVALVIEEMEKSGLDRFEDIIRKLPEEAMNSKALEGLIKAGAFSDVINIATALDQYKDILSSARDGLKNKDQITMEDLFADFADQVYVERPELPELSEEEKLACEKEVLGAYVSGHPLNAYAEKIDRFTDAASTDVASEEFDGKRVICAGMITEVKTVITKKGEPMAFLTLEDMVGDIEAIVFPKVYVDKKNILSIGETVILSGDVDEGKILVENLSPLTAPSGFSVRRKTVWVRCENGKDMDKIKKVRTSFAEGEDILKVYDAENEIVYAAGTYSITEKTIELLRGMFSEKNVVLKD